MDSLFFKHNSNMLSFVLHGAENSLSQPQLYPQNSLPKTADFLKSYKYFLYLNTWDKLAKSFSLITPASSSPPDQKAIERLEMLKRDSPFYAVSLFKFLIYSKAEIHLTDDHQKSCRLG